ncbi:TPA: hypothetical protein ACY3HI_004750 [Citrobacter braakii]
MMKKRIMGTGSLFVPALFAGIFMMSSSQASTGEVQFVGVVESVSCDLITEVDGVNTGLVQLGTSPKGGTGPLVRINLKPDMNLPGCQALPWASDSGQVVNVSISWVGPFVPGPAETNPTILKPQSGLATDAVVELLPLNANDASGRFFNLTGADQHTGLQYTAQLKGGSEAGDYQSAAAFVIAWQ